MTEDQSDAILSALTRIADALDRIEDRLARDDEKEPVASYDWLGFAQREIDRFSTNNPRNVVKFDADDAR